MSESDRPILARLLAAGEFVIRFEEQGILVAQRVRPPRAAV